MIPMDAVEDLNPAIEIMYSILIRSDNRRMKGLTKNCESGGALSVIALNVDWSTVCLCLTAYDSSSAALFADGCGTGSKADL
jgi:hypothetical protein